MSSLTFPVASSSLSTPGPKSPRSLLWAGHDLGPGTPKVVTHAGDCKWFCPRGLQGSEELINPQASCLPWGK